MLLPKINDGFTGIVPDIKAPVISKPLRHYGPRPRGMDEKSKR
jgi:hypothetical protein